VSHLTIHRMAALISEALDTRGMSQAEFSRLAGVSAKHLCKVLGGTATAPLSTLDYWAFLLGARFEIHLVEQPDTSEDTP